MTVSIHCCPHCGADLAGITPLNALIFKIINDRYFIEIGDIRAAVAAAGVTPTRKQIYNALGHLTRRGKVRKLGYGAYAPQKEGGRNEDSGTGH